MKDELLDVLLGFMIVFVLMQTLFFSGMVFSLFSIEKRCHRVGSFVFQDVTFYCERKEVIE